MDKKKQMRKVILDGKKSLIGIIDSFKWLGQKYKKKETVNFLVQMKTLKFATEIY